MIPKFLTRIGALLIVALMVSGCATTAVVTKIATTVTKPIFGLMVKDAYTTMGWIEVAVANGTIAPVNVELAKRCPEAVLALDALRTQLIADAAADGKAEGFRGMIYFGTVSKYGGGIQGVQTEFSKHLSALAESCMKLIPAGKLLKIMG